MPEALPLFFLLGLSNKPYLREICFSEKYESTYLTTICYRMYDYIEKMGGMIVMKKRATFTIDEDVFEGLKMVPRSFSVSEFVSFMLRGMLKEMASGMSGKGMMSQEEFEKWVSSDPELKKVREGIRESLGPFVYPVVDKVKEATKKSGKKK